MGDSTGAGRSCRVRRCAQLTQRLTLAADLLYYVGPIVTQHQRDTGPAMRALSALQQAAVQRHMLSSELAEPAAERALRPGLPGGGERPRREGERP